jgi:uncharacterized coiled-coil protein SlyX
VNLNGSDTIEMMTVVARQAHTIDTLNKLVKKLQNELDEAAAEHECDMGIIDALQDKLDVRGSTEAEIEYLMERLDFLEQDVDQVTKWAFEADTTANYLVRADQELNCNPVAYAPNRRAEVVAKDINFAYPKSKYLP